MTIIEELQLLARHLDDTSESSTSVLLRSIAGRLERSGALVPVADGLPCMWDECDGFFEQYGKLYRFIDGTFFTLDWEPSNIVTRHTIQPIRLVPITEAEIDGN